MDPYLYVSTCTVLSVGPFEWPLLSRCAELDLVLFCREYKCSFCQVKSYCQSGQHTPYNSKDRSVGVLLGINMLSCSAFICFYKTDCIEFLVQNVTFSFVCLNKLVIKMVYFSI